MIINIAKHSGFCFGVKRAIQMAEETAQKNKMPTYVYGQLVHNEKVIDDLENKGMIFVDELEDIPNNALTVLRAHGEPGTTYEILKKKSIITGKNLNDATCPLVTLVHNIALKLKNNNYEVIIFGKPNHPEAIGTSYHIRGKDTFIARSPDDFKNVINYIQSNRFKRVALISQTTMSVYGYRKLIENLNKMSEYKFEEAHLSLKDLSKNFIYVDTICNPTKQRQLGTEELARQSDIMVVIGGKNSSNSKELAQKCKEHGVETYFIQTAEQLDKKWFINKEKIGISAGASTPDETINLVAKRINEICGVE